MSYSPAAYADTVFFSFLKILEEATLSTQETKMCSIGYLLAAPAALWCRDPVSLGNLKDGL